MVSDQFLKDYRRMTAEGVAFTPEDIIRLNALSVKTRRAATSARELYLPRLAFLPRDHWFFAPLVLREPTIAHDLWLEMAGRVIDTSREANFLFLNAYALSRHPGRLADPSRPKRLARAVSRFAERRLASFTRAQLRAAVEYALFGNDWTFGETAPRAANPEPRAANPEPRATNPEPRPSPTIGLLTDARMMRLPITTDDAMRMTSSELTEAINRAWDLDKRFDQKRATAKAFGEYVRAREEIRARSKR